MTLFGKLLGNSPTGIGGSGYIPSGSDVSVIATTNNLTASNIVTALDNSTGAALDVTGISGGTEGAVKWLLNRGTSTIDLPGESASSTATNRFAYAGQITSGSQVMIYYNGTRWEIFS